jgi:hypothetical protein
MKIGRQIKLSDALAAGRKKVNSKFCFKTIE